MQLISIVSLLSSIFILCLSVFVFLSNRKNKLNIVLALFTLGCSGWFFSSFMMFQNKSNIPVAIFWDRSVYIWTAFLPSLLYHLALLSTNFYGVARRNLLKGAYACSFFFLFANIFLSEYFIGDLYIYPWGVHSQARILHHFFAIFLFSYICLFFVDTISYHKKLRNENNYLEALRLRYLIFGMLAICVGSIALLPAYGIDISYFSYLVYFSGAVSSVVLTYAIVKHQLLDIKVVIKKAFIFSVSIAVISGALVEVSFLSSWFAENIPGFGIWTVPLIVAVVSFAIGNLFWRKSQEVDRIKSEFVTVAAHKLRTPLTKIKWAAMSLQENKMGNINEEQKDYINYIASNILNSNSQLVELTENLLASVKEESQQYKYNLESTNLKEITEKVLEDFQKAIKEKNINFSLNVEENFPNINFDKLRISSVIQILLENAITYTKNEITINLKKDNNYVVFSIKDNGIGVDKKEQGYIFSKFFRTHRAYIKDTEGTGIGLFVAKSIIERHHGKIGVRSEGSGRGSEFWFSLPIDDK